MALTLVPYLFFDSLLQSVWSLRSQSKSAQPLIHLDSSFLTRNLIKIQLTCSLFVFKHFLARLESINLKLAWVYVEDSPRLFTTCSFDSNIFYTSHYISVFQYSFMVCL